MKNPEHNFTSETEEPGEAVASYVFQDWIEAGKPAAVAIILAGEDELTEHYLDLVTASEITINFAGFMDGRGFSHAGKLRQLGFSGRLIADGDLLPDQWGYLQRCGFDVIASGEVASHAKALPGFSERYQSDARESEPLFRRKRSA